MFQIQAPILIVPTAQAQQALAAVSVRRALPPIGRSPSRRRGWRSRVSVLLLRADARRVFTGAAGRHRRDRDRPGRSEFTDALLHHSAGSPSPGILSEASRGSAPCAAGAGALSGDILCPVLAGQLLQGSHRASNRFRQCLPPPPGRAQDPRSLTVSAS